MISINAVGIDGIDDYISAYGESLNKAAVLSVNDTARHGHSLIKTDIMGAVNLTSSYIGSANNGRLRVSNYAKSIGDSAVIQGRQKGTMLYRFVTNNPAKGKPLRVSVGRGSGSKEIKNSFAIRLSGGNMALVVRVPSVFSRLKGSRGAVMIKPRGRKKMAKSASNLWILYAPSINQLMKQRVIKDDKIKRKIGSFLSMEFNRQLNRIIS